MIEEPKPKDPKRVAAGRLHRKKWKGITPEGLERLRQSALKHQPWRFSTGPKSELGKKKVAENGKKRQAGPVSVRKLRSQLADVRALMTQMQAVRRDAIRGRPWIVYYSFDRSEGETMPWLNSVRWSRLGSVIR